MIVILGFVVLLAATLVGLVAVATNTGSTHTIGDQFSLLGHPLTGVSTGRLFLDGIVVGVVGMLGLSILLGTFNRRLASRGARRDLKGSRRESAALRLDRERLTQQLDDQRSDRHDVDTPHAAPTAHLDPAAGATPEPAGLWHRIKHSADRQHTADR